MKWVYLIVSLPVLILGCIRAHDVYVVLSGASASFSLSEAALETTLLFTVGIVFLVRAIILLRRRQPMSQGFPVEVKTDAADQ